MASDFTDAGANTSPDALRDLAVASIQEGVPGLVLRESNLIWLTADALAELVADAAQTFLNAAAYRFRVQGRELWAVAPVDATQATATVTLDLSDPDPDGQTERTIPAGAQFEIAGRVFTNTEDVTGEPGDTLTLTLAAVIEGADGSGLTAIPALLEAYNFVDPDSIALSGETTGGVDAEPDATYEQRLARRLRHIGRPVLPADFSERARETSGVARALAIDGYVPAVDEQQTITVTDATGGTFTITYDGQTTGSIAHDGSAGVVLAALEALSNIDPGDVTVSGGPLDTGPVTVTFIGALAGTDVPEMTVTSSLTGAGGETVDVDTIRAGAAAQTGQERTVTLALVDDAGADVSSGVKTTVQAAIEAEREVNWDVFVIDPTRTTINVAATVVKWDAYDAADVDERVEAALTAWLDPAGWGLPPFGEIPDWHDKPTVRRGEAYDIVYNVPGVKDVTALTLNAGTADVSLTGPAGLPEAGTITVTVS